MTDKTLRVMIVISAGIFLAPLLILGPADHEEYVQGIFSTLVHVSHLFKGEYLFWYDNMGFGTPFPIVHRFDFHPVFFLSPFLSIRVVMILFWIFSAAIGLSYFRRVLKFFNINNVVTFVCVLTYLLSATNVYYFYNKTDWPTIITGWALFPMLLYYTLTFLREERYSRPWVGVLRISLIIALMMLNSHPGYLSVLFFSLAVFVVLVSYDDPKAIGYFMVAALIALFINSERYYYYYTELGYFYEGVPRHSHSGFSLMDWMDSFSRPFTGRVRRYIAEGLSSGFSRALFDSYMVTGWNVRIPFTGALFFAVAMLTSMVFIFDKKRSRLIRAASITFILCAVISTMDREWLYRIPSGVWLFRDPMIVFGIIVGGVMLDGFMRKKEGRIRKAVGVFLAAHCVHLLFITFPAVYILKIVSETWPGPSYNDDMSIQLSYMNSYKDAGEKRGIVGWLAKWADKKGKRIYGSPTFDSLAKGRLSHESLYGMTDLSLAGMNPVNGWYKGVSMDPFYPSRQLWHGYIIGERRTIMNRSALNVAGIDLIVMNEEEAGTGGFEKLGEYNTTWNNEKYDLVLLHNKTAWPKANLLKLSAADFITTTYPGCPNDRFLCQIFAGLDKYRLDDPVTMTSDNGEIDVVFPSSDEERLLMVSMMYRPEWRAETGAGEKMEVIRLYDAFLGVKAPPGVSEIKFRFVPRGRMFFAVFSAISGVFVFALYLIFSMRHNNGESDIPERANATQ